MEKKIVLTIGLFAVLLTSCIGTDPVTLYHFIINNETDKILTLDFKNSLPYSIPAHPNSDEIVLLPNQEMRVRNFAFDSPDVADCIKTDFDFLFGELVFDTYVDGEKTDKELWRPENWTFCPVSKNEAEYKMVITESDL